MSKIDEYASDFIRLDPNSNVGLTPIYSVIFFLNKSSIVFIHLLGSEYSSLFMNEKWIFHIELLDPLKMTLVSVDGTSHFFYKQSNFDAIFNSISRIQSDNGADRKCWWRSSEFIPQPNPFFHFEILIQLSILSIYNRANKSRQPRKAKQNNVFTRSKVTNK